MTCMKYPDVKMFSKCSQDTYKATIIKLTFTNKDTEMIAKDFS